MLVRYFRRPSRIEQLRSSTGGHLLERFAKELSQGRYQWVAARKHIRAAEERQREETRRNGERDRTEADGGWQGVSESRGIYERANASSGPMS